MLDHNFAHRFSVPESNIGSRPTTIVGQFSWSWCKRPSSREVRAHANVFSWASQQTPSIEPAIRAWPDNPTAPSPFFLLPLLIPTQSRFGLRNPGTRRTDEDPSCCFPLSVTVIPISNVHQFPMLRLRHQIFLLSLYVPCFPISQGPKSRPLLVITPG